MVNHKSKDGPVVLLQGGRDNLVPRIELSADLFHLSGTCRIRLMNGEVEDESSIGYVKFKDGELSLTIMGAPCEEFYHVHFHDDLSTLQIETVSIHAQHSDVTFSGRLDAVDRVTAFVKDVSFDLFLSCEVLRVYGRGAVIINNLIYANDIMVSSKDVVHDGGALAEFLSGKAKICGVKVSLSADDTLRICGVIDSVKSNTYSLLRLSSPEIILEGEALSFSIFNKVEISSRNIVNLHSYDLSTACVSNFHSAEGIMQPADDGAATNIVSGFKRFFGSFFTRHSQDHCLGEPGRSLNSRGFY